MHTNVHLRDSQVQDIWVASDLYGQQEMLTLHVVEGEGTDFATMHLPMTPARWQQVADELGKVGIVAKVSA